ncbi:choline dehydrogenase-like flavoprotein [Methylohalomonas lacus]|uniref:Choline dehydrogenase-like flavoprotein n=1 Tax=Methylohalomonas lacus TaxID=398773 RepID=A0AAE3HMT7_9GAMM|nr:GMC family oxidoreductase [Methylohalomonas lacus]MCS3904019.1 choline dehydrogenase-like flavoprotein [Methylohalomonas lacus]
MADADYDVIVIGSGAGGGACLWALAQQNARVLLLEAGPAYDYREDYRLDQADWETEGFPAKVPTEARQTYAEFQRLESRWDGIRSHSDQRGLFVTKERRQPYAYHHVVGLGGSTLHFTGEAHRLNPQAMRMQTRFSVAADWPFGYDQLEPYYIKAEKLIGVAGPAQERRCPRSAPYPLPAHTLNYSSRKIRQGCSDLDLNLLPNSLAILSQPHDGRPGCNYCNNCTRGCPRADKGSVDVTFIRRARQRDNCEIRTGATVIDIETTADDRIAGVLYRDADGRTRRVNGRAVVVACGAVETPRLLMNCSSAGGRGLANESGQLGRNFMETISWLASGLHPENLGSHRGIPADAICWDFNTPDAIDGVIGGCRFNSSVGEAGLVGPISYAKRVVGGWGHAHKQRMRETFGRILSIGAIGESLPNPGSYIDLDPDARDANGLAKARIHSFLDDMALQRLIFMANKCRDILNASGVESIVEEYGTYDYFSSTHVFGTARMGHNPDTSVVNEYGRSHRWKNLFIADASVFPSSGGGEAPSLTIQALALRTADNIVRQLADKTL